MRILIIILLSSIGLTSLAQLADFEKSMRLNLPDKLVNSSDTLSLKVGNDYYQLSCSGLFIKNNEFIVQLKVESFIGNFFISL